MIRLSDQGRCKLQEGKHCYIHKYIGPEYLRGVCRGFPRLITSTPRGLEFAITPACIYAARTFLNKAKAQVVINPPDFHFSRGAISTIPLPQVILPRMILPGIIMCWKSTLWKFCRTGISLLKSG